MNDVTFDRSEGVRQTFACPACGDPSAKTRTLTVAAGSSRMQLFRCGSCGTFTYHPFPSKDYTRHTSELPFRDYVEIGAAIYGPAHNIFRVMPPRRTGRMIDIGCGYGFALDVVRTMRGWEVRGYEPSQYGARGRSQLGVDIVSDFAPVNQDPRDVYDIVHCSEVIEHVHDARAFVDLLVSYLSPRGVLVLTTPDPGYITPDTPPHILLPLLSAGSHTIMFSERALTDILRNAGLECVRTGANGISKLYYASRAPIVFRRMDGWDDQFLAYLFTAAKRAAPGSPLASGLRYRAFRTAMDTGKYDMAASIYDSSMADPAPQLDDIHSIEQFAERWPFCMPATTYYAGMLCILHKPDYSAAAGLFRAAFELCRRKIDLAPANSVVESDLLWRARYHQAFAENLSGDARAARETLAAFEQSGLTPPVPADLLAQIATLRIILGSDTE